MMLRAAFVPSDEAVAELRSLIGRLSLLPGVRPLPPEALDVHVAGFGNLVRADAKALAQVLAKRLPAALPQQLPVVRCGSVSLTSDREVVVGLRGDVDALAAVAGAVGATAESMNLYVDRRRFRPEIVVATVEEQKPGSRLETVLSTVAEWEGMDWEVDGIALAKVRWLAGRAESEELGFVPFVTEPVDPLE